MTNYELYHGAKNALKVFEQYKFSVHMTWAFAAWLDIEGADTDDEITYLTKLEHAGILAAPGYKRLQKLRKRSAKQARGVRDGE